ncbi:MAG: hypothetical protein L0338_28775 [Acidobacteria bacterium]|nr:hypothetical protein [Acidobacteriota bacterium]
MKSYLALALEVATEIEAGHPDSLPSKATAASVPSYPHPACIVLEPASVIASLAER